MSFAFVERRRVLVRALQQLTTVEAVMAAICEELATTFGYRHAWLYASDPASPDVLHVVAASGTRAAQIREALSRVRIGEGSMLAYAWRENAPVVVEDARTDPRTDKRLVATLDSRTLIHIPICALDHPLLLFGTGTFSDEGCRPPSADTLRDLTSLADQLAIAVGRIRLQQERRQAIAAQAAIAHEISTPLCYVALNLGMAQPELGAAKLEEYLTQARSGLDRVDRIVRDMKRLGWTDEGIRERVDVEREIDDAIDLVAAELARRHVELVRVRGAFPMVYGDASRLGQVILNLLVNALGALPDDAGRITVTTGTDARGHASIEIEDTGAGIAPEHLPVIFQPFFTTKAKRGGTGLGLAICHSIMTSLGGEITVASQVGIGTIFRITLPARERISRRLDGAAGST